MEIVIYLCYKAWGCQWFCLFVSSPTPLKWLILMSCSYRGKISLGVKMVSGLKTFEFDQPFVWKPKKLLWYLQQSFVSYLVSSDSTQNHYSFLVAQPLVYRKSSIAPKSINPNICLPGRIIPLFFSSLGFAVPDELGNKQTDRLTESLALL